MTKLITLDFETFYSKEFSLSKMTTEAYIRSPDFQVIGFAYMIDDADPVWVTGGDDEMAEVLHSLDIPNSHLVCHNAVFDGAILAWRYGILPKYYFDTLSMARPLTGQTVGGSLAALAKKFMLGEKGTEVVQALGKRREDFGFSDLHQYGEYCKNDVRLTYTLFNILREFSTPKEMYIIDLMLRMYTDPVLELDRDVLSVHLQKVRDRKEALMAKIDSAIGRDALMSNPKFAELLQKLGVEPPMKISPATKKETYAFSKTDVAFKALLEHPDERVQALVAARLGVKSTLEETRTESFLAMGERGRLPIMLNYYGAHTGRASGGDKVNFQNLPRGGALRRSIKAPDGHQVVACDSSQIEARVVAWLAGQDDLIEDFRNNVDIYSKFASVVYGRPIDRKHKEVGPDGKEFAPDFVEGFVGKTCIAEGTLVLSNRGWKPIEQVSLDDKLWDGEEWVCHQGLADNGIKTTLSLCGAWLTPDHLVWSGTQWLEAQSVVADKNILSQVLATAAENSPSLGMFEASVAGYQASLSSATATVSSTRLTGKTSKTSKVLGATFAQNKQRWQSAIGSTLKPCLMMGTVQGYSTDSLPLSLGVTPLPTVHTSTTESVESQWRKNGAMTAQRFFDTFRRWTDGIGQSLRWTESMSTVTTNQATSDSSREVTISRTSEGLRISKRVFDILNCGSRNRFTILTDAGPVIVHNCILGLGYGMGKDKFKQTLKIGQAGVSVDMPIEDCERTVSLYRTKYDKIAALWKEGQEALDAMVKGFEYELGAAKLRCTAEGILLPNGMVMRYANLRRDSEGQFVYDTRYGPNKIYGGKVIENVVQALARIVVFDQMAKVDQLLRKLDTPSERYRVVLTVHDEVVCVVPHHFVTECLEMVRKVMSTPPKWCADLPVACEAESGSNYADCK